MVVSLTGTLSPFFCQQNHGRGFLGGSVVKNPPAKAGDMVQSLVWEDPYAVE